jgi:hypothetical protein
MDAKGAERLSSLTHEFGRTPLEKNALPREKFMLFECIPFSKILNKVFHSLLRCHCPTESRPRCVKMGWFSRGAQAFIVATPTNCRTFT